MKTLLEMLSKSKLAIFALMIIGGAIYYSPVASAESSIPDTSMVLTQNNTPFWDNQDFYVYVKTGERFRFNIELLRKYAGTPVAGGGVDVQFFGENGYTSPVTRIYETDPVGTTYNFQGPIATQDSVWRLSVDRVNASANLRMLGGWEGGAYDSSNNLIPGRMFTYAYHVSQRSLVAGGAYIPKDISVYNVTRDGYVYQANYLNFMGIDSYLRASSYGNVDNNCHPIYKSYSYVPSLEPNPQPDHMSASTCPDKDPLFFVNPLSAGLPETAQFDDGQVKRIMPTITATSINNLTYTHSAGDATMAGQITAQVSDYAGSVTVKVDVDNDGNFDGALDRAMMAFPDASGNVSVDFDGRDANGNPIPIFREMGIRLLADKPGETHFVRSDVEWSAGGIEVIALNGPIQGVLDLHWDDTALTTQRCGAWTINPMSNLDGVSSAGGVHSWDYQGCVNPDGTPSYGANQSSFAAAVAGSSWGNIRHIDDWVYNAPSTQRDINTGPHPELHIEKSVNRSETTSGSEVEYTLSVVNRGSVTIPHVVDMLPDNLSVIESRLPADCSLGANRTIECVSSSPLESNQTINYVIHATVEGDSGSSLENTARVYGLGDPGCLDDQTQTARCNSSAVVRIVDRLADTGDNLTVAYVFAALLLSAGYLLRRANAQ
ncbi:hypothetical protein CR969_02480 [Candidatus Saccharibacteria bacterium]|nr:MAG: hypothetical protein CR969_02480 [Candidatus Saccharibacteria bacterium]